MSNLENPSQNRLTEETINKFEIELRGQLIRPGDSVYDEVRKVWNGLIDKYPALIARCVCVEDVIAAVRFARLHGLVVAVRGGKHNVAGSATCEGGLVIDLSPMKRIEVNPQAQTVRADAGVILGELDRATQRYGLATPLGLVSQTGIAGLTLGGGLGWLRNMYGLTCDNLIAAEVVTADGNLVRASETENMDLLWGLRGGGGNFGIVTSFEYRLYPVGPEVMFGFTYYPGRQAKEALQFYREYVANCPDEVSSIAFLGIVPARDMFPKEWHDQPFIVFSACYAGPAEEGKAVLQPLRQFTAPIADFSGVMPYVEIQTFFDEDYPAGKMRNYWKSAYLNSLSDEVIETLITLIQENPSHHTTLDIWHLGGAVNRVKADATAYHTRHMPFLAGIESNWEDPEEDKVNINWNRKVYSKLQAFSDGSEYLNFPGFYEDTDNMVKNSFGANHARLTKLKQKYDPTNFFSLNQNIKPDQV